MLVLVGRWLVRRRLGLQPARGKALDALVAVYGLTRKSGESDKKLRARAKELHEWLPGKRVGRRSTL